MPVRVLFGCTHPAIALCCRTRLDRTMEVLLLCPLSSYLQDPLALGPRRKVLRTPLHAEVHHSRLSGAPHVRWEDNHRLSVHP